MNGILPLLLPDDKEKLFQICCVNFWHWSQRDIMQYGLYIRCIGWYCCFILCRWDISISDVSVLYDLVQILLAMDFWEIR